MKVSSKNIGYYPEIIGIFRQIDTTNSSYDYYLGRHPGGVFHLQLSHLVEVFYNFLIKLEELQNYSKKQISNDLILEFHYLVYSLMKYYESCYEIILACCKKHEHPKEGQQIWIWLEKNNYSTGKIFYQKIEKDVEWIRLLYNKLKHSSSMLNLIYFYNDKVRIMGFFVDSVDNKGLSRPDQSIHKKFEGQDTGTSFNFIIPQLFYLIYKIAISLEESLYQHYEVVFNQKLTKFVYPSYGNEMTKLLEQILKLSKIYFPNEFSQDLLLPKLEGNDLIFESTNTNFFDLKGWSIQFFTSEDGFTKTYQLPYWIKGSKIKEVARTKNNS